MPDDPTGQNTGMQRGSDKHSPRVDEQLKHETASVTHGAGVESHSREEYQQEPPAEGERVPNAASRPDVEMPEGLGIDPADADARAELASYLGGDVFPARTEELVSAAQADNAPAAVLAQLRALPDSQYDNVQDVWVALGGEAEANHTGHRQD